MKKMENIKKIIIENGGVTLDGNFKEFTTEIGFMVSYKKFEFISKDINIIIDKMLEYKEIAKKLNAFVGVWYNGGRYYLDISLHIKDFKQALKFGIEQEQKAIFDYSTFKSINIIYDTFYTLYKIDNLNNDIINVMDFDTLKDASEYLNIKKESLSKMIYTKSRIKDNYYLFINKFYKNYKIED